MWKLTSGVLLSFMVPFVPVLSFCPDSNCSSTQRPPLMRPAYDGQQNRSFFAPPAWPRPLQRAGVGSGTGSNLQRGFPAGNLFTAEAPLEMVSDQELRDFSELLLGKEGANNAAKYVRVNYQSKTTSRSTRDEAAQPLLSIDSRAYNIPTIKKLTPLYDNYVLESNMEEYYTPQEKAEENDLIEAVVATPVMEATRKFLTDKGKISGSLQNFKDLLKSIWFDLYSRGKGIIGSSGFEHVFLAEIKRNQVSGLHNWLYFHEEEKKNRVNYLGYMRKIEIGDKGAILKFHFQFNGIDKPVASMFIGFSPEFEMALYTVCYVLRANHLCPLQLERKRFAIRTYSYDFRSKNVIGSAFPEI